MRDSTKPYPVLDPAPYRRRYREIMIRRLAYAEYRAKVPF
jgi:hypothetical protein